MLQRTAKKPNANNAVVARFSSSSSESDDNAHDDDEETSSDLSDQSTSQGDVSIVRYRTMSGQTLNAVRKVSKCVDNVMELEESALKLVKTLNLPFFAEYIDSLIDKETADLQIFTRLVHETNEPVFDNVDDDINCKLNFAYQTCVAARILHERLNVSHGDLHTSNVLRRKCVAAVHVFIFSSDDYYAIRTYGVAPVLIDFGYAFVPNERMMMIPDFSGVGYFPMKADYIADARLYLMGAMKSLEKESKEIANATKVKVFRYAVIDTLMPIFLSDECWNVLVCAMKKKFVEWAYTGRYACKEDRYYGIFKGKRGLDTFEALFRAVETYVLNDMSFLKTAASQTLSMMTTTCESSYVDFVHAKFHDFVREWNAGQYNKLSSAQQVKDLGRILADMNRPDARLNVAVKNFLFCMAYYVGELYLALTDSGDRVLRDSRNKGSLSYVDGVGKDIADAALDKLIEFRHLILDEMQAYAIPKQGWFVEKTFPDILDEIRKRMYATTTASESLTLGVYHSDSDWSNESIDLLLATTTLTDRATKASAVDEERKAMGLTTLDDAIAVAFKDFSREWLLAGAPTDEKLHQLKFMKLILSERDVTKFESIVPNVKSLKLRAERLARFMGSYVVDELGVEMCETKDDRYARAGLSRMKDVIDRLPIDNEEFVIEGETVDVFYCGPSPPNCKQPIRRSHRVGVMTTERMSEFIKKYVPT